MLFLKKSLDLCDEAARASARDAVLALAQTDANIRSIIAHRIYCACKAQDAEPGYSPKSIYANGWEDEWKNAPADYLAIQALGWDDAPFSTEAEDALCDAFEALSGHVVAEQQRIASGLTDLVAEVAAELLETATA